MSTSGSTDCFTSGETALKTGPICTQHNNCRQRSRARCSWGSVGDTSPSCRAQVQHLQCQGSLKATPGKSWGYSPAPELPPAPCPPDTTTTSSTSRCSSAEKAALHKPGVAWPKVPGLLKGCVCGEPAGAGGESLPVTAGCLLPPVLSSPPLPSEGNKFTSLRFASLCPHRRTGLEGCPSVPSAHKLQASNPHHHHHHPPPSPLSSPGRPLSPPLQALFL